MKISDRLRKAEITVTVNSANCFTGYNPVRQSVGIAKEAMFILSTIIEICPGVVGKHCRTWLRTNELTNQREEKRELVRSVPPLVVSKTKTTQRSA